MDIVIVESIEPEVLNWLRARHAVRQAPELAWDPRGLQAALQSARALLVPAAVSLDAAMLAAAPRLQAVARLSAGVENVDRDACKAAGIEVVRPYSAIAAAEAEFVVGALLQMLRRVPVLAAEGLLVGRELGGCTVGLVGMTPTARPLSALLAAFGARVVGYDPGTHASDPLWARYRVTPSGLPELFAGCEAVCLLLPYYSRYQGLVGDSLLQAARSDQVLVCLSHSDILDDAALARALCGGRLAAAWLDAAEPGLVAPRRALHAIETLTITPRVAATTRQSRSRAAWAVARRLDELLAKPGSRRGLKPATAGAAPGQPGA